MMHWARLLLVGASAVAPLGAAFPMDPPAKETLRFDRAAEVAVMRLGRVAAVKLDASPCALCAQADVFWDHVGSVASSGKVWRADCAAREA